MVGVWRRRKRSLRADSKQALKLLNGLVNKSLVTVDHLPEGGVRYRLLDSICEFLRKGLSSPTKSSNSATAIWPTLLPWLKALNLS